MSEQSSTSPDSELARKLPEGFSIRPASEDDLSAIVGIEHAVHAAPWTEEHFRAELDKPYSRTLVATDDETDANIAAYIVYWVMGKDCEILNVAVSLPNRGQGFAQVLVRKVIDEALRAGVPKILLDVRKTNKAALQLYQKVGFTVSSVRKAFYSNGEDAYQMTLHLEGDNVSF